MKYVYFVYSCILNFRSVRLRPIAPDTLAYLQQLVGAEQVDREV